MKKPSSPFRLTRIIDNSALSKEVRFQACMLLLEKAVADTNLDMYERIKRQVDDKIIKMFPDDKRPKIPANLDDINW